MLSASSCIVGSYLCVVHLFLLDKEAKHSLRIGLCATAQRSSAASITINSNRESIRGRLNRRYIVKKVSRRFGVVAVLMAGMLWTANIALAQQTVIPVGTVLELRMSTGLDSGVARVNDPFRATVVRSVWIDGKIAVVENSVVDGRVTVVEPAQRGSKSGVIGVEFTRLTIGTRAYAIEGVLTSLRADERRQIIDSETNKVTGSSSTDRNIVFIGGGAGAGAVIGAVAGGGKGAGIGALTGGGLGVLGALIAKGNEAEVQVGSEVGMELLKPVSLVADRNATVRQSGANDRSLYTSANMVRAAQTALYQRNYYQGGASGVLDAETRRSIAHFQIDNNQPASGDLDQATVSGLGLVVGGGNGNGGTRQVAMDLNRKASALQASYQLTLGVQVADIRARPQLSESSLDLLLQLNDFTTAAMWYEQASRTGNGSAAQAASDNFGRILLRSARRVEASMQLTGVDRAFSNSWSAIRNSLNDIRLDERMSTR